jgi:hypothetical protein
MKCPDCGQSNVGQTGEYPCPTCGLPTLWDSESSALIKASNAFPGFFLEAGAFEVTKVEWIGDTYTFEAKRRYRVKRIK